VRARFLPFSLIGIGAGAFVVGDLRALAWPLGVGIGAAAAAWLGWWLVSAIFLPLRWAWPEVVDPNLPTREERGAEGLPAAVPSGWIPVLASHELRRGEVKQVRALGRLLVAYRGESGRVAITDPFCPHLGASLADGSVSGDCLRCPFHGWQFDAVERGGECTLVPYTTKLPTKSRRAQLGTFPSLEGDGHIWLWHDAAGRAPSWQPEDLVVGGAGRVDAYWTLVLPAHVQDLMENQADFSHAGAVHGDLVPGIHFIVYPNHVAVAPGGRLGMRWPERAHWPGPALSAEELAPGSWRLMRRAARAGASAETVAEHAAMLRGLEKGEPFENRLPQGGEMPQEMTVAHVGSLVFLGGLFAIRAYVVIRQVGPCFFKIRLAPRLLGKWRNLPVTVSMAATPRGAMLTDVRVTAIAESRWLPRFVAKIAMGFFYLIGRQDFRIWSAKRWLPRPVFVEGDGDIPHFRRWYAQFYPPERTSVSAIDGEERTAGTASGK
jgi:nitrite reductase/ring-hydroxylating ferredoxin subunit